MPGQISIFDSSINTPLFIIIPSDYQKGCKKWILYHIKEDKTILEDVIDVLYYKDDLKVVQVTITQNTNKCLQITRFMLYSLQYYLKEEQYARYKNLHSNRFKKFLRIS